jgi:hypothetical protein
VATLIKQRVPGVDNVVGWFEEGVDHPLRRVARTTFSAPQRPSADNACSIGSASDITAAALLG